MNLPNSLTLARIVLTFPIVALLQPIDNKVAVILSFVLFIIASLTDFFDGYFARKLNMVTNLGKFLDQISDKILVTSLFVVLLATGKISMWLLLVIVMRDTIVSGVRMIASSKGKVIAADWFGKAKTVSQMIFIIFIYANLIFGIFNQPVLNLFQWLVGILTAGSGLNYLLKNRKVFEGRE